MKPIASFQTASHGELLFVLYDTKRFPRDVVTRETQETDGAPPRRKIVEYEFSRNRKYGTMFREGEVDSLARKPGLYPVCVLYETDYRRDFWVAAGVPLETEKGVTVTDPAALNYRRLRVPRGDPFCGATETDSGYCGICDDAFPEGWFCSHIFRSAHGDVTGPGVDGRIPDAFVRFVRFVGCARVLRGAILRRDYPTSPLIAGVSFRDRVDALHDRDPDAAVEGLHWVTSIDRRTVACNEAMVEILDREIAHQTAQRAKGLAQYEVWSCGTRLEAAAPWSWARARAARLREGNSQRVTIRRRIPKRR